MRVLSSVLLSQVPDIDNYSDNDGNGEEDLIHPMIVGHANGREDDGASVGWKKAISSLFRPYDPYDFQGH